MVQGQADVLFIPGPSRSRLKGIVFRFMAMIPDIIKELQAGVIHSQHLLLHGLGRGPGIHVSQNSRLCQAILLDSSFITAHDPRNIFLCLRKIRNAPMRGNRPFSRIVTGQKELHLLGR